MKLPDTNLLRTFVMVIDHGGFSEAAKALDISQSAVSQKISLLEQQFGKPIFSRFGRQRQLSLTHFGKRVLSESRHLLNVHRDIYDRLVMEAISSLTIGISPMTADVVLPDVLGKFSRSMNDIKIRTVIASTPSLLDLLESGDLDLAFTLDFDGLDVKNSVGFVEYEWFSSRDNYSLNPATPVPIITYGSSRCKVTEMGIAALEGAGLETNIVAQTEDIESAYTAARTGVGLVLLNSKPNREQLVALSNLPRIKPINVHVLFRDGLPARVQETFLRTRQPVLVPSARVA